MSTSLYHSFISDLINVRYIETTASVEAKCPHGGGLSWEYYDGTQFTTDTTMKVECDLGE